MLLNLGHKSQAGHRALREGCPWGLAWPRHTGTVAGTVFCPGTPLGLVTLCVPGGPVQTHPAAAAAEPTKWLSASFPSLSLSLWAGLLCCPAVAAAGPVSGRGGRFQEEMGHLLGERCFGLQWHTLIKHRENIRKGLRNGPKRTAVLRCPSDSSTTALRDASPAYTRTMPVPGHGQGTRVGREHNVTKLPSDL